MPDASFILPLLLHSALLPFGVTLALLLALRALRCGELTPALALAAGFLASYFAVFHMQWSFPPHQALDWMPWIVLLGGAAVVAIERAAHSGWRLFLRLAISFGTTWLVAWPALTNGPLPKAVLSIAVIAALICAAWSWLATAAKNRPTPAPILAIVAGGAALTLMLDASQVMGQFSGALSMALCACAGFNVPRVRAAFSGAATGLAVLLLGALLSMAHLYAGVSLGYIALLAGALLADPLVALVNRARARSGSIGTWVAAVLLAGVPVLVAVGLAVKAASDSGGY